jgi:large subunit ribosomal protein L18
MRQKRTFQPGFRRRREQKTDYDRRLKQVTSNVPRLVVRKSNAHIRVQLVAFDPKGDRVLAQAFSQEFRSNGWKSNTRNSAAAYLTGQLAARRAKTAKIDKAQLDIGFHTAVHRGVIFAALKGAIDGGLVIPHDPAVLPADDRCIGKNLSEEARQAIAKIRAMLDKGELD